MFPSPYPFTQGSLPGIEDRRAPANFAAVIELDKNKVPQGFPMHLWTPQAMRYYNYWRWYNGDVLNEMRAKGKDGKNVLRYPLGINPIRNFSHKHAAVLLGEEQFDSPYPMIRVGAQPLLPLDGSPYKEEDKALAAVCQNTINEVWAASHGRAIQTENAVLQQFLGGCVFQLSWQDWRTDLRIPITIKKIVPDFFLPVWQEDNPWNLLEAYVVYRFPALAAYRQYGYGNGSGSNSGFVIYTEHWTPTQYSIYLDAQPLTSDYTGRKVTYDHLENPFGVVPFVYIPRIRSGSFWGESLVENINGLARELNARTADKGDAIREMVHRKRYVSDLTGDGKPKQLGEGVYAMNLGATNAFTKATPKVTVEDAPVLPESVAGFTRELWDQMLRDGDLSGIAFGEDEGSQRSSLTLAFRMWPTTSHVRMSRTFWNDGLSILDQYILQMVVKKQEYIKAVEIAPDWQQRISISQRFLPSVPRDREQMVNEVILRVQTGILSPETAIRMLGDVEYVQEELALIKNWEVFRAMLNAAGTASSDSTGLGDGAETKLTAPIASDMLEE